MSKRKDICPVCGKLLRINFKIVEVNGLHVKKPFADPCCGKNEGTGKYCINNR